MTALARKLTHVIWHLLTKREPYRYAPLPRTRTKLLKVTDDRDGTRKVPQTIEEVYAEAGLPGFKPASAGERRGAANNRRARTRMTKKSGKQAKKKRLQKGDGAGLTNS